MTPAERLAAKAAAIRTGRAARTSRGKSPQTTPAPLATAAARFAVGDRVRPTDRHNIGTIVDTVDGRYLVRFVSEEGEVAKKQFSAGQLQPLEPAVPPTGGGQPVRVPEYTPFPVHALPVVLRQFVTEVAESVSCDPAFAALPALTLAGAAVGGALVVSPKRKFREPPALWCCTVGDSGTGKSPAFARSEELAMKIDKRLRGEHDAARERYEQELEAWKGNTDGDPGPKPAKPVREHFAVIDCTIERLAEMLAGSPRGLIVCRDELDGWFGSFTKYKGAGGGSDVPNWLSMFDAGPIRSHRKQGDMRDIEADRGFVAVSGGIQPDVLRQALSNQAYMSSGLAARLLFAMPPKACPRWSDVELSDQTERAFASVLDFLRGLPFDVRNGPGRVGLQATALDRFKRLNNEFAETAEGLDGGPMAAVLPKAVRISSRLALVWWCVSQAAEGRDPGQGSLTDEAMAAGEELARWFVGEAERVYAVLAERPEDRSTRTLADLVRRKGGRVRARDLQRSNAATYPSAETAEAALDGLVAAGLGVWHEDPPGAAGGRPSRVFVLGRAPDTRHNPTELGAVASPPPDTTPEPPSDGSRFAASSGVVSGSVGCRVTATPVPQADADGEVVSDRLSPTGTPAVWDDDEQFFALMTSRGWKWPGVLAWLKTAPDAVFFALATDQRRQAAEHLQQLAPAPGKANKK